MRGNCTAGRNAESVCGSRLAVATVVVVLVVLPIVREIAVVIIHVVVVVVKVCHVHSALLLRLHLSLDAIVFQGGRHHHVILLGLSFGGSNLFPARILGWR